MLWLIRIGVENLSGDVPALQSPEKSFPSDLLGPVFDLADHEEWRGDQADENEHHAECDADDRGEHKTDQQSYNTADDCREHGLGSGFRAFRDHERVLTFNGCGG